MEGSIRNYNSEDRRKEEEKGRHGNSITQSVRTEQNMGEYLIWSQEEKCCLSLKLMEGITGDFFLKINKNAHIKI